MVHTYIRFRQDCKILQQGIGEMALFLQYCTIIHEIYWILDLIDLLNYRIYNFLIYDDYIQLKKTFIFTTSNFMQFNLLILHLL